VSERERLINLLADCHDDPDLFNTAFLGRPPYWRGQREIAQSVVDYRITVAYTGNAVGKDYLVGGIIPWWCFRHTESQCIVTGPSQNVLGSVTWKELRRANDHSKVPLGLKVSHSVQGSPLRCIVRGDWGALGYSTTSVERASGQHNPRLLVIGDEASGIADVIYDALDSLKYYRFLLIGNPVQAKGRFVDLIRQADKDRLNGVPRELAVNAIRISSLESPHAHLDQSPFGLADRTWLQDVERRYGRDSLWYRSHVLAEVPTEDADSLIPIEWLDRAGASLHPPIGPFDVLAATRRISCDLGEGVGRDSTALCVRDDVGVLEWVAGNALGLAEAASEIARLAKKWGVPHNRISFDRLGVGRDLPNHLRRHGIKDALGYAGSSQPQDKRSFTNLRTEAAWKLRRRLNPDWCLDPRYPSATKQAPFSIKADSNWPLVREELEQLTYDLKGNQTRLIKKEDLCIQLGRSPDRSDALIQSFAFD
jgi:hypothetical protein